MASVSHLKKLVDSQRPAAEAAMRLRLRVDREQARREDLVRRGSASEPLRMLAALTGALPKGAWVQRLEWNGQAIRIVGSKSGELDMPAAIRGSGFFTNPRSLTAASAPRPGSVQPFDITADARARTRA
jgi:Tfp pilus assembly protein PilN